MNRSHFTLLQIQKLAHFTLMHLRELSHFTPWKFKSSCYSTRTYCTWCFYHLIWSCSSSISFPCSAIVLGCLSSVIPLFEHLICFCWKEDKTLFLNYRRWEPAEQILDMDRC